MPTRILLAPVGAGKTESTLDALYSTLEESHQPMPPIWVLLATRRQQEAFRERLALWDDNRQVYFNVELFDFYELYARLLAMAGQPVQRLHDAARLSLLRTILIRLQEQGTLRVFGSIAHTPGFVAIVADFVDELKHNLVSPADFAGAARSPKDHDLAAIYAAYQQCLVPYHLVDKTGEGWLALQVVRENAGLARAVELLLVDGFDQFTRLQSDLITLLADRARQTLVTLTTVPSREDTIGRRFEQALLQLEESHQRAHVSLSIDRSHKGIGDRHVDLQHLLTNVFLLQPNPRPSTGGISLIEAPDPAQEVRAVLRRVKRLLLDGVRPDAIVIALRHWDRYQQHFASLQRIYGVQLALHYGEPLSENPAIIALLNLLALYEGDFRRRELLDVLRAPYFDVPGLDSTAVDTLDRMSQRYVVTGGQETWLEAIDRASKIAPGDEDDERDEPPMLSVSEAVDLSLNLETFFDQTTPLAQATVETYARWLEMIIGTDPQADPDDDEFGQDDAYALNMVACIRRDAAPGIRERDLSAMYEFKFILRSLISAQELLASLGEQEKITRHQFMSDLRVAVENSAVNPRPHRAGRVLVTTVTDARGLPHDHVFVLGLSEGIFPASVPEDPLYLDSERLSLTQAGVPIQGVVERAADDGLFYELISLARDTLTLSRPTIEDGQEMIDSHLWRAVTQVYSDSDQLISTARIKPGEVVRAKEVATRDEALLVVAEGLSVDVPEPTVTGLYNWLLETGADEWLHVARGRQIETDRLSRRPHNHYSGRLSDPGLIARIGDQLGPDRRWSASQFNDYGYCGFRFFANRLLKLERLEEPEEGVDAVQLGTLNHAILERTYRELAEMDAFIVPEYRDDALDILYECAHEIFESAPEAYGFRATALWEQETQVLLRRLEALVKFDFSPDNPVVKAFGSAPRQPYWLEASFGLANESPVGIDIGGDVGRLRIGGLIDRVDRQGDRVIVIDYKTGSTPISTNEMQEGRNFQMIVYLLATKVLLDADPLDDSPRMVAGGLFWHIRNRKGSGQIVLDEEGLLAMERAQAHLARYIAAGRTGDFAVQPNKPDRERCVRYCEFYQLCRTGRTNRYKF